MLPIGGPKVLLHSFKTHSKSDLLSTTVCILYTKQVFEK